MAEEDFPDIGADPEVDDETEPLPEDEDFEHFTMDELVEASNLREHSPATIVMSLYFKMTSAVMADLKRPTHLWDTRDYVRYSGVVGSLGSNRMVHEEFGVVNWDALPSLEVASTNALKARLLVPRSSITSHFTCSSLAAKIADMRGATLTPCGNEVELNVPGCPIPVRVSVSGGRVGRVVKGGKEFVEWHNNAHGTAYAYAPISDTASAIAFFISCMFRIDVVKDAIKFIDNTMASKKLAGKGIRSLRPGIPPKLLEQTLYIRRGIIRVYKDVANRPAIGHKAEPLAFLEFLIERVLILGTEGLVASYDRVAEALTSQYQQHTAKVMSDHPVLFSPVDNAKIPHSDVAKFIRGDTSLNGGALSTFGAVAAYVDASRNTIRVDADLARKSDTPFFGSAVASRTSVPQKVSMAIRALTNVVGKIDKPVDAFGTGKENHWHYTVVDTAKGGINFYDVNGSFVPPLGGKFEARDITLLEPDKGVGRILFDDTFLGSNAKAEKIEMLPKVEAVVRANYDAGFMKLYMGSGCEGTSRLSEIPKTVKLMMDHYPSVVLVPGGSPHSPEYFLIFAKGEVTTPKWYIPARTPLGYGPSSPVPTKPETRVTYVRGWMATRALELVRANVQLNLQVLSCVRAGFPTIWPCYEPYREYLNNLEEVKLAGAYIPSSRPVPTTLGGGKNPDEDASIGEVTDWDDAPAPPLAGPSNPGDGKKAVGALGAGSKKGDGPPRLSNQSCVEAMADGLYATSKGFTREVHVEPFGYPDPGVVGLYTAFVVPSGKAPYGGTRGFKLGGRVHVGDWCIKNARQGNIVLYSCERAREECRFRVCVYVRATRPSRKVKK